MIEVEKLSLSQLEKLLLETEDVSIMYRIQIQLAKKISGIHQIMLSEKNDDKRTTLKSQLSWATEMLDIAKRRGDDLRNESAKYNYRFRVEAKRILREETYNSIAEKSKL